MASFRASFIIAILVVVLVLKPADAIAETAPTGHKPKCQLNDKTCRPADRQAPEDQEEEANAVNVKAAPPPASQTPTTNDDMSDELNEYNKEKVVLGH
ncbi:hypothetical protein FCM35_KLT19653 [Carex littledalei]|uniref:Uncharacterized protein n=1 Tax=Carex littledalei TaxID=544730 RepID=A0A833R900_9POAL|nr:hypothetical protein FCM35_KLT19653 [Carex littledalei]